MSNEKTSVELSALDAYISKVDAEAPGATLEISWDCPGFLQPFPAAYRDEAVRRIRSWNALCDERDALKAEVARLRELNDRNCAYALSAHGFELTDKGRREIAAMDAGEADD